MHAVDFVVRKTSRKTILLEMVDALIGGLLLVAVIIMVTGVLYMLH